MFTKRDLILPAGVVIAIFVMFDMLDGDADAFRFLVGQISLFVGF